MFFSVKESYADRLLKRREEKLLQKQMDDDMRELARESTTPAPSASLLGGSG
jgi:hypothetical protein